MQDWLSVGNGWRNLFLLSNALQAFALGLLFARHRWWVKRSRLGAFLAGAAVTPLLMYLWTLLLALLWPHAPKLVYIGVLPALAGLYLIWLAAVNLRRVKPLCLRAAAWLTKLLHFDKPALLSLSFALALLVLLMPIVIRTGTSTATVQADAGEYMALGQRYCEDRDLSALLAKEDAAGHFRGHSHFPSMELYMVYGLMHTGETIGYPYDKPMLTGIGLLVVYLLFAFAALLIQVTRGKKRWVLLGLMLFNLVPNFVYSLSSAPRDTWRCLALLLAAVALVELRPAGGWRRYLGKLLFVTALCFTAMSAHVVCFVVLPFIVAAWVLLCWLEAVASGTKSGLRTLLGAAGLALGGAAGTLLAYAGNLWCYAKWGQFSPWRLMTTYTTAPWYDLYMQGEYKLEITTRQLDFWQARYDIVMAYATPIGIWGLRLAFLGLVGALIAIILRRIRVRREVGALLASMHQQDGPIAVFLNEGEAARTRMAWLTAVLTASLLTLFTLAPMSGLLDTKLYSFSGSFLTMQRYTLQWYMFASCAIVSVLAAVEALWPNVLAWLGRKLPTLAAALRARLPHRAVWLRRAPAYLCALLCVLALWQGTKESGYANSIYRYGRPMLTDQSMALDESFKQRYSLMRQLNALVGDDQKILITRVGYQYALRAKGYLLTSNPIVPLMNLPLAQVPEALVALNVAALCTEPDFWDERYYAKSTLSEYLSALPPEQIVEDGHMRIYLLDTSLVGKLTPSIAAQE